jgi:hypothetical protein
LLVLDSGDLLARDGRLSDGAREAAEIKGDLILRSYAYSGIDGMTPGDGDLALGLDWLVTKAGEHQLPYVCANLQREDGSAPFEPWRVVEKGEMKIGLFGVTGGIASCEGCAVTDAVAAATAAVADLQGEGCHQIIGLSHLGVDDDVALAEAVPGIDFIIASQARGRMRFPRVAGEGPTHIVQEGNRGRQLGRIQITFADGAKGFADGAKITEAATQRERTATRLTDLEEKVASATTDRDRQRHERSLERTQVQYEQFAIADMVAEGRHEMTIDVISLAQTMAEEPEVAGWVGEAKAKLPKDTHSRARRELPQIGEFAGSSKCRSCHQGAYRQWRQSKHARAFTALVRERKSQDTNCFTCHITGYHLEGGPRSPAEVSYLRNVQCEACHGASAGHVADSKVATPFKGKVGDSCSACHNEASHGGTPAEWDRTAALAEVSCDDSQVAPTPAGVQPLRVVPPEVRGATTPPGAH